MMLIIYTFLKNIDETITWNFITAHLTNYYMIKLISLKVSLDECYSESGHFWTLVKARIRKIRKKSYFILISNATCSRFVQGLHRSKQSWASLSRLIKSTKEIFSNLAILIVRFQKSFIMASLNLVNGSTPRITASNIN